MIEDFNIRDNNWNPLCSHYFIHTDTLRKVANLFNLELSISIAQVSTRYTDNSNNSNSVIDLMFLWANAEEFDIHTILLDLQSSSDHTLLTVNIIISKEFIQDKRRIIVKNSKEEARFIKELTSRVECIDITNISDCKI